eukprot:1306634-Alexandrium_andersonii.AAC.1
MPKQARAALASAPFWSPSRAPRPPGTPTIRPAERRPPFHARRNGTASNRRRRTRNIAEHAA